MLMPTKSRDCSCGPPAVHDAAQDLLAESNRDRAISQNALAGLKVGDGLQACLVSVAEIIADRAP